MVRHRFARTVLLAGLLAGLAGCGPSTSTGGDEIALTVTRDYGRTDFIALRHENVPPKGGVARILQRYPNTHDTQSVFVNGILATDPLAQLELQGGDRVWLDQHDAGAAVAIPAVVGAFPEPFVHGADGKKLPVRVECEKPRGGPCSAVADTLVALGVVAGRSIISRSAADNTLRILVAPWKALRGREFEADSIDRGPAASGVFARFDAAGDRLLVLNAAGTLVKTLGAGTGLIAATREKDRQPVWFVTGTDAAGVAAAARAMDESVLGERFALAISNDLPIAVPQP
jgi:hypothetical protein